MTTLAGVDKPFKFFGQCHGSVFTVDTADVPSSGSAGVFVGGLPKGQYGTLAAETATSQQWRLEATAWRALRGKLRGSGVSVAVTAQAGASESLKWLRYKLEPAQAALMPLTFASMTVDCIRKGIREGTLSLLQAGFVSIVDRCDDAALKDLKDSFVVGTSPLWLCGCGCVAVAVFLCGCVAVWLCGCVAVAVWLCGCVAV